MPITFAQLEKHLSQQYKWTGFTGGTFEPTLMSVADVLGCRNSWSIGKETIRDFLKKTVANGQLPDFPTIMSYTGAFRDGPVILVGFTLDTPARIWKEKYGGMVGADLVIWDGHHRTEALAIREQLGVKDDHPVIVFVGK